MVSEELELIPLIFTHFIAGNHVASKVTKSKNSWAKAKLILHSYNTTLNCGINILKLFMPNFQKYIDLVGNFVTNINITIPMHATCAA